MKNGTRPMGDEGAILRWAVGGMMPAGPRYDEALLLEAAKSHRIGVRLHRRLSECAPDWASTTLSSGAADLAQDAVRRTGQLFGAFREILTEAEGHACEPLLLKGLSYYLTLGLDQVVTWSADLDLIAGDLPGLCDLLSNLGYVKDPKDPPQPHGRRVFHEYAKFNRESGQVDVHSRFPVWRYPAEVASSENVEPGANPSLWRCIGDFERHEISAAEFLGHRRHVPGLDGRTTPITTPEMVALVSCCHIFANYVAEFPRPYATVRLGEVANLGELTSQSWFDWTLFHSLTLRCDAADAVAFAFSLLQTWLGVPRPGPTNAHWSGPTLPPRDLWFARGKGGFLVSTGDIEPVDDLLVRTTTLDSLLDHLGANEIRCDPNPVTYQAVSAHEGSPTLGRVLTHRQQAALPFQFSVRRLDAGLEFLVTMRSDDQGNEINILLYFADGIFECIRHPDGELHVYDRRVEMRLPSSVIPFSIARSALEGRATYRAMVPWRVIPGATPADEHVPLLLGVRRWGRQGDYPEASTLIPLLIVGG
jgi:hypothetical protein